ncbi:hypothetical protein ACQQ2N_12285 [Dokdonella sp. MW10]|uniref:hypothetical protein n=1 Tax=Dokdonella sp. MW10 TaxID=2992926 RepID=UPI003F801C61
MSAPAALPPLAALDAEIAVLREKLTRARRRADQRATLRACRVDALDRACEWLELRIERLVHARNAFDELLAADDHMDRARCAVVNDRRQLRTPRTDLMNRASDRRRAAIEACRRQPCPAQ